MKNEISMTKFQISKQCFGCVIHLSVTFRYDIFPFMIKNVWWTFKNFDKILRTEAYSFTFMSYYCDSKGKAKQKNLGKRPEDEEEPEQYLNFQKIQT